MLTAARRKILAARRRALLAAIGNNDIVIVPAAGEVTRSRDTHYPFRQDSDFAYLTGFPEPEAIAVLAPGRKDGAYLLFVRPRNAEREIWEGRRAGPDGAMRAYGADQAFDLDDFETQLSDLLAGRHSVHYTLAEHPALDGVITGAIREIREVSRRGAAAPVSILALETTLHEQRLHKRADELKLMARAAQISAEAHVLAMQATRPGRNEWEIAAVIERHFLAHRMVPGYGSIVGGGENACILHYTENNAPLQDGDLLLIDAGGELDGYTADITRTFPVNGRFSPAQRALYEVVLKANLAAIKTLRVGTSVGKPHEVATRILTEGLVKLGLLKGEVSALIKAGKHRQFYMHGTGHWLGMDVHDVGRYKLDGAFRRFAAGMVMTVEPGLYVAPQTPGVDPQFWGIGIRIEDDVVVTDDGPVVLTDGVPKTIAGIEALMAASG